MNYFNKLTFSKDNPKSVGTKNSYWILNGIGFELENGYFSVYIGLDDMKCLYICFILRSNWCITLDNNITRNCRCQYPMGITFLAIVFAVDK